MVLEQVELGAATVDGSRQFEFSGLYNEADRALYEAKHSGRDRVQLAEPGRHTEHRREAPALTPVGV